MFSVPENHINPAMFPRGYFPLSRIDFNLTFLIVQMKIREYIHNL